MSINDAIEAYEKAKDAHDQARYAVREIDQAIVKQAMILATLHYANDPKLDNIRAFMEQRRIAVDHWDDMAHALVAARKHKDEAFNG